jgi:hypothetical protein
MGYSRILMDIRPFRILYYSTANYPNLSLIYGYDRILMDIRPVFRFLYYSTVNYPYLSLIYGYGRILMDIRLVSRICTNLLQIIPIYPRFVSKNICHVIHVFVCQDFLHLTFEFWLNLSILKMSFAGFKKQWNKANQVGKIGDQQLFHRLLVTFNN